MKNKIEEIVDRNIPRDWAVGKFFTTPANNIKKEIWEEVKIEIGKIFAEIFCEDGDLYDKKYMTPHEVAQYLNKRYGEN